jgi:signal transduction histidine kinase
VRSWVPGVLPAGHKELNQLEISIERYPYARMVPAASPIAHLLVEKLLNFGRAEAGATQYHFESVELGDLIRPVAAEFQRQAGAGEVELALPGEA